MKKRQKYAWTFATALVVAPCIAVVPTQAATIPFSDIKKDSELYNAVSDLYNNGIVFGTTSTTFSPFHQLTRGEAAYFLAQALQLQTNDIDNPGFSDVTTSHPYYESIAALAANGIIQKGSLYHPNASIKRSQMAKMLTLGFHLQQATSLAAPFTDFTKDMDTDRYIQTLVNYEITQGTSATTFSPYKDVLRGQMALFLYRILQTNDDGFYIIGVE